MLKKQLQLVLIFILFALPLAAQDADYLFDKANEAYQQEKYQQAINLYQQIIEKGRVSGKLFYNLGNAYYKINEIGEAILYYKKAKKLMPDDKNVAFNLKLANVKVKDRIQAPPPNFIAKIHDRLVNLFSLFTWSIIFSLAIFLAAVIFLLRTTLLRKKSRVMLRLILISLVIAAITLYPTLQKYQTEQVANRGVLLNNMAAVYAAPDSESTRLFDIHEGTAFDILDVDGPWYKIQLIDGKQGWLPQELCGEI
ncbi:MAG: tetratricopeptide repeat protein [Fidelibacterota bacterium]